MSNQGFNEMMRRHREKHAATMEVFYVSTRTGRAEVQLIKVKEYLENTIGIYVNVGSTKVVMLGQRRVYRPEPGFRYHEFKRPGRAGLAGRNL